MDEQLLTFPIDVKAVMAHMKQDMRDDWFGDSIKYEDLYQDKDSLLKTVRCNLEFGHGQYLPGDKQVYDVPKTAHGLRYTLETDFYDRFLYQAICSYLIKYYDPLLSNRIFSHRYSKYRSKEKYIFKNRIELWQTFQGLSQLAIHDGDTLLITDLINYFEHISINSIENAFLTLLPDVRASGSEKNKIRSAVYTLRRLLEKWCFNNSHGLPQNRDPSSFIANVVLHSVDKKMIALGYDYYRYVDDIRIICPNVQEARKSLSILISELRKLGMNINSKKTEILNNVSDKTLLLEYFPDQDDRTIAIDNMWKSRNKKVITRSIPLLYEMLLDLIESNKTQSRQFRFCINRFKSLISTNIFDSKSFLAKEIAKNIIEHLEDQPVSTDQFCKLLAGLELENEHLEAIELFILDKSRAIFHWQNFHLWLLLGYKKYKTLNLINEAITHAESNTHEADVSACFIYLASVGETKKIENLIPLFEESWPYQHQRFFLIALQDSAPAVLKPLVPKINFKLEGTIKRIKQNKDLNGFYISELEASSFEEIYDELSPYD